MTAQVNAVRSIELAVVDLAEAQRFFTDVWNLDVVDQTAERACLRGTGSFHHILALHRAAEPAVVRITLQAADERTVRALHEAVSAKAVGPVEKPGALTLAGGGFGFGFKDAEGRNFAIVSGVSDHAGACPDHADRPRRITHVNLNAVDGAATSQFLMDTLGFKLSDETGMARFLRCNTYHNALVIGKKGPTTLNHIAFELPDLESVMRSAGRLQHAGYPIEWGPGRHGPGNNVFCYFLGAEDAPVEYTADVMIVDDTHVAKGPSDWGWPAGRTDRWGITGPISRRFERIQTKWRFTRDGYRVTRG